MRVRTKGRDMAAEPAYGPGGSDVDVHVTPVVLHDVRDVRDLRDVRGPQSAPALASRDAATPSPSDGSAEQGAVLMVCSSGGHLAQLMALRGWWSGRRTRWVTFDTADARSLLASEDVVWGHHPTTRNVPNLLRNGFLALRMLVREQPAAIVSTGAGIALPFFVLGRALRVPTVYIEVVDRIETPTLTGRLCRPFTTRMLVQWEEQRDFYRGATVVGPLL